MRLGGLNMAMPAKLALLPVDLVRLTFDFLNLTEWHVARSLTGLIGVAGPSSGPFCVRRQRSVDASGQPCAVCSHAHHYSNLFIFRLLCRWVSVEPVAGGDPACVCRRRRSYRASFLRYAWAGAAIAVFWVSIWFGTLHWLAAR